MRIKIAAWAFGLARPYSQFSSVRSLVRKYLANQAANAKTVATIRRYIYSIAVLHRLGQCPNPTKHASVTTALKRIVRELGTEQVQQGPLRWEHIEPALERLDTSMPRDAFAAALVCDKCTQF